MVCVPVTRVWSMSRNSCTMGTQDANRHWMRRDFGCLTVEETFWRVKDNVFCRPGAAAGCREGGFKSLFRR